MPNNTSVLEPPATAADKAAALTYLKTNYEFPKTIQYGAGEDASVYELTFVTNHSTGSLVLNVRRRTSELTAEHVGTAYLDAMELAQKPERREDIICKAVENTVQEFLASKKAFIKAQMEAIQQGQYVPGDIVSVNGVQHTVTSVKNQQIETTASQQQSQSKGLFAGLLGALGAIGASSGMSMGVGIGKEAAEAQKIINDLQKAQLDIAKKAMKPPVTPVFVCSKCGKTWDGAAPKKCFSCGALIVSSDKLTIEKQKDKEKYYNKAFIDKLKAGMMPGKVVPVDTKDDVSVIPQSVKDAMSKQPAESDDFVDTSNDEQKFLQRIGMMSNLNVSVQGRRKGFSTIYRLFCDKCKQFEMVDNASVIVQRKHDDPKLVAFCNTHRHIAASQPTDGERKFKDV